MNKETKEIEDSHFGSKVHLQIGDYVLLRLSKPDEGWLSSAGLLDNDCYVNSETNNFENCIWEIHVQNQYSALREYKEAISRDKALSDEVGQSNNRSKIGGKNFVHKDHLDQLHRAAINEQRLNERLMNLKIGKPVLFGDPVQLRHVKSKKFLTVSSHLLAKEERENMRISVTAEGDSLSCLDFLPRYRFDREGQVLSNNSEVLIRVHERPGEYIHAAKLPETSTADEPVKSEVNCSLENSNWTIMLFQRAQDIKSNLIRAGELVTLQDSDSLTCLSLIKSQDKLNAMYTKPLQLRDLVAGSTSHVGTNLLWLVEKEEVTTGGPILANMDQVTLRDLNSGKYLKVESEAVEIVTERSDATLFTFSSTQGSSNEHYLESNASISLTTEDFSLSMLKTGSESLCIGTTERDRAISFTVSTALYHKLGSNLFFGVESSMMLKEALEKCSSYQNGNVSLRELTSWLRISASVLDSLATFLSSTDSLSGSEWLSKEAISCRQNMIREQGILDILLDILVMLGTGVLKKVKNVLTKRDTYGAGSVKGGTFRKFRQNLKESYDRNDELDRNVELSITLKKKRRNSIQLLTDLLLPGGGGGGAPTPSPGEGIRLFKNSSVDSTGDGMTGGLVIGNTPGSNPKNRKGSQTRASLLRSSFLSGLEGGPARRLSAAEVAEEAEENDEVEDNFPVNRTNSNINAANDPNSTQGVEEHLIQKALKVLLCSISENRKNQSYVADRFPVLLSHVKQHRLAVLCVEEMLRENLQILQTKVRQREIDIFVSLLAESPMSVTFLQLIQSTCACPMGVDATQRMVSYALFGFAEREKEGNRLSVRMHSKGRTSTSHRILSQQKHKDTTRGIIRMDQQLMIKIVPDRAKLSPVTWGDFNLYCPLDPNQNIVGYAELSSGLPEIYLQWKVEGRYGELSMYNLYGYKDRVPLSAIYGAISTTAVSPLFSSAAPVDHTVQNSDKLSGREVDREISLTDRRRATIYQQKSGKSGSQQAAKLKAQVAEYFITQLYLVADLCLDRNYVSIGMLENLYEFDVLVTMLKDKNIPNSMKAAVCRVIRCLYIDREPQVEGKFPRYIRTNVALGGEVEDFSDKLAVHYEWFQFALLQQIIADFLHQDLDLSCCDKYSTELIRLLQSLVKFGFYFGIPQMFDVLKPLIRCLDDHQYILLPVTVASSSGSISLPVGGGKRGEPIGLLKKAKSMRKGSAFDFSRVFDFWKTQRVTPRETMEGSVHSQSDHVTPPPPVVTGVVTKGGDDDDFDQNDLSRTDRPSEYASNPVKYIFRKFLYFTESSHWTAIVLLVTFLSIAFTVTDIFNTYIPPYFVFASIIFFICDLAIRFLLVVINRSYISKFIRSPYNIIDCCLIALDIVIMLIDTGAFPIGNFRLLRVLRLARVFKAARLIKKITKSADRKPWQFPARYKVVTRDESQSIVTIMKVLIMFYDRIQDKTVDITMRAFAQWCNDTKNNKHCDAVEVFNKMMSSEEKISSELSMKYDQVLLDTIMYQDREMTQEAVKLLMIHKSQKELFFQVCEKIQIIYSPRVESICKGLSDMLGELKRLGDMYEIWSELQNESDQTTAQRAMDILNRIRTYLAKKNEDRTLGIRTLTLVDEEVQNILRNLDAMSAFMSLMMTLSPRSGSTPKDVVLEIVRTCADLVCLFVRNSEANQQEAFKHLEWLVDRVDDNINTAKIIRALLEGNKMLIKRCPRKYLLEFAQKIVTKGQNPDYLEMYVGMSEYSNVIGSRVIAVEAEIGTYLTAREWKRHILLWCDANDPAAFAIRKQHMEKCAPSDLSEPPSEEELSPELRYHIRILSLLGTCNLGPKIHAIYSVNDVLLGLLDKSTIFPVKKALANILIAQIKMSIDRVEKNENFWEFLQQSITELENLPDSILKVFRSPTLRMQKGEWIELLLGIITQFFELFDMEVFSDMKVDKFSTINFLDIGSLVDRLYSALKTLSDSQAAKLGEMLTEEVTYCMKVLKYHMEGEDHVLDQEYVEEIAGLNPTGNNKLKLARAQRRRSSVVFADEQQVFYRNQFQVFINHLKTVYSHSGQVEVLDLFHRIPRLKDKVDADVRLEPFLNKLTSHFSSQVKRSSHSRHIPDEVVETCKWFLRSARYFFEESLGLSCDGLTDIDVVKFTDTPELTELRNIYNDNGVVRLCMELIAVGIDHGLCLEAMKLMIALLMRNGGAYPIQATIHRFLTENDSALFFELIKEMLENLKSWSGNDNELFQVNQATMSMEATSIPEDIIVLQLLSLVCEGSYLSIRDYFRTQAGNSKFVNIIENLAAYLAILSKNDTADNNYITTLLLRTCLRFVQGPSKANQEQFVLHTELLISLNRTIRNIRPLIVQVRSSLTNRYYYKHDHATHKDANGKVLVTVASVELLKESVVDLLRGIIEGQSKTSLVFDRVTSSIDFSVLQAIIFPEEDVQLLQNLANKQNLWPSQAKYLIFTQSMTDSPSHRKDGGLDDSLSQNDAVVKQEISSVEVLWHNEITVVYFHIPDSIKDLSSDIQNGVLENIQDYASRELKLMDFMKQCKQLYRQSRHQQFLKRYGLERLWNIKHYLQRIMFANAVVINCLVVSYFGESIDGHSYYAASPLHRSLSDNPEMLSSPIMVEGASSSSGPREVGDLYEPGWISALIMYLIIIQTFGAFVIIAIHSTVQLPVTFGTLRENTTSIFSAIGETLMDPLLLWYIGYAAFCLSALLVNHLFVSVLLLDWIVISPITQDLLRAILYPAKQLIVTLVLILICMNIFSGAIFVFYRQDGATFTIHTMWETLKLCISYGFRGEYGYDHEMIPTLGNRMVMDVLFYFVILSILREIFFAIIVDTFGTLREIKFERENEEKNSCFICGIERHEYDLMASSATAGASASTIAMPVTFSQHRSTAHNPMHYLYFILNIWNQTPFDDSSLEMYVRQCLANNDVSWFPTGVLQEALVVGVEAQDHALKSPSKGGATEGGNGGNDANHHHSEGGHGGGGGGHDGKGHNKRNSLTKDSSSHDAISKSNTMQELLDKINAMNKQLNRLSRRNAVATEGGHHHHPSSSHHGHGHGHGHGQPTTPAVPSHHHHNAAAAIASASVNIANESDSSKNNSLHLSNAAAAGATPATVASVTSVAAPSLMMPELIAASHDDHIRTQYPAFSLIGSPVTQSTATTPGPTNTLTNTNTHSNTNTNTDICVANVPKLKFTLPPDSALTSTNSSGKTLHNNNNNDDLQSVLTGANTPFTATARSARSGRYGWGGDDASSVYTGRQGNEFQEQMETVTQTANRLESSVSEINQRLNQVETTLHSIEQYITTQESHDAQDREFLRSSLQSIYALLKTKKALPALKESSLHRSGGGGGKNHSTPQRNSLDISSHHQMTRGSSSPDMSILSQGGIFEGSLLEEEGGGLVGSTVRSVEDGGLGGGEDLRSVGSLEQAQSIESMKSVPHKGTHSSSSGHSTTTGGGGGGGTGTTGNKKTVSGPPISLINQYF